MSKKNINIVLIDPEIPQNTGNVGRTCVGLAAKLHLVGQMGFTLDEKQLKRAGMDYWDLLDYARYKSWDEFLKTVDEGASLHFMSTKGKQSLYDISFQTPCYLVFGNESRGLPPSFYDAYKKKLFRIPMEPGVRSLNLATAAGVAAYEAARQLTYDRTTTR